ncbi:MAG: peptide/nickel transport system substrate-binding protein [Gaiellaceae bacterium]|nr:peptide/nickel transport system substrate-binding protein [Gaiellaceae bacterium]
MRHLTAVAAFLVVALAAGCGGNKSSAPPTTTTVLTTTTTTAPTTTVAPPTTTSDHGPDEFADFKVAMDGSIDYLDPGLADTAEGWGVMWNVYLPLIGYKHASDSEGAKLVPYLATALPEISPNGRVYTLQLRPGLRYSNGDRVHAVDFKRTIERDIVLDSAGAALFDNIAGVKQFARTQKGGIAGIRIDPAQEKIEIHLVAPEADFENILASEFAAPVPTTAPPADTTLHPLPSTGPYQIVSYQPRGRIVEVRNPHFQAWRFHGTVPAGNPDRVTWDIVPTARAALRAVLSGKDDWMGYWPIPADSLPGIEARHEDRLRFFTPPNLSYFFMNTRRPPFDKVAVRQAVNYAISRKALVHLAGGKKRALTTENILPPGYPSYGKHLLYRHNMRKAKKLVAQSGYRGKTVTVWNHDVPGDLLFTDYLVSVLKELGFRVQERVLPASDYWATLSEPTTNAQIGFANWLQDYPHPLDWFGVLLDGRQTTTAHNDNYAYFDVPWVNRKIEYLTRQPTLTGPIDRQWRNLDRRVMELAPWAPFLNREGADFFSARVRLHCYVNNVLYGFDYATICLKK